MCGRSERCRKDKAEAEVLGEEERSKQGCCEKQEIRNNRNGVTELKKMVGKTDLPAGQR